MRRYLLVFSLLGLFFQYGCIFEPGSGTYEIQETLSSPGNKFTAFVWIGMGGGAAGWCSRKVSILPTGEKLPIATEPEKERINYVFRTRCSSEIQVTWLNDDLVKISYSLGDDPFPTSMSQASRTEDGRVRIIYEIIEK